MKRISKLSVLAIMIACSLTAKAQISVFTGFSPTFLVQNTLLGGGIIATNMTYTGGTNAIGYFYTGIIPSNLGITYGIVMTTGVVNGTPPIGSPVSNFISTANYTAGDPDLQNLIPGYTVYDASVLQFDFVPTSDTIRFKYAFASEEYPEYVGSNYNDVFGFFISGPNPAGGNYTNKNLAIIPGTMVPVSINNVNGGTYPAYYVDNQGMNGQSVVFDGFTTVLTAWCVVVPCVQYHIKLAVGDAGDRIYDSGVFLERNSFISNALTITTYYTNTTAGYNGIEGCNDAIVSFKIPATLTYPLNINYSVLGTAINGTDYSLIPSSVTIPPGQDSVNLVIHPYADGITEGVESVMLAVQTLSCGLPDTVHVSILDQHDISMVTANDTAVCSVQPLTIWSQATGTYPPFTYQWSNGDTNSSTIVTPVSQTVYHLTVMDMYGCQKYDSVVINTLTLPAVGVSANPNPVCSGQSTTLTATGAFIYGWSNGLGYGNPKIVVPTSATTYTVTGTGVNGCSASNTVSVTTGTAAINISALPDPICAGESSTLTAGGGISYNWSNSLGSGASVVVQPGVSITYTVTGTDISGCTGSATYTLNVVSNLTASVTISANPSGAICTGSAIVFNAAPVNGGIPSFQWLNNGIPIAGAVDSFYTSNALANLDVISCIMTSSYSCANNNPDTSNAITLAISTPLDATITPAGPYCNSDPPVSLTSVSPGGTWSGTGIADSLTGSFDPAAAGQGAHQIIYTIDGICFSSDTINILVYLKANATIDSAGPFCPEQPQVTLTAADPGGTWMGAGITNSVNGTFSPALAGTGVHNIIYEITGNCGDMDTMQIKVLDSVAINAEVHNESCRGKADGSIEIAMVSGTPPFIINWNISTDSVYHLIDLPAGTYNVTVTDFNTCVKTRYFNILASDIPCFIETPVLYLPNIFTPNGDGQNDVLYVKGVGIKTVELLICDRWGEEVFNTIDQSVGWDGTFHGKLMGNGVYTYYLKAAFIGGEEISKKGTITLSR